MTKGRCFEEITPKPRQDTRKPSATARHQQKLRVKQLQMHQQYQHKKQTQQQQHHHKQNNNNKIDNKTSKPKIDQRNKLLKTNKSKMLKS